MVDVVDRDLVVVVDGELAWGRRRSVVVRLMVRRLVVVVVVVCVVVVRAVVVVMMMVVLLVEALQRCQAVEHASWGDVLRRLSRGGQVAHLSCRRCCRRLVCSVVRL